MNMFALSDDDNGKITIARLMNPVLRGQLSTPRFEKGVRSYESTLLVANQSSGWQPWRLSLSVSFNCRLAPNHQGNPMRQL